MLREGPSKYPGRLFGGPAGLRMDDDRGDETQEPGPSGSAMRRLMTRPIHAHLAAAVQPRTVAAEVAAEPVTQAPADALVQIVADAPAEAPAPCPSRPKRMRVRRISRACASKWR